MTSLGTVGILIIELQRCIIRENGYTNMHQIDCLTAKGGVRLITVWITNYSLYTSWTGTNTQQLYKSTTIKGYIFIVNTKTALDCDTKVYSTFLRGSRSIRLRVYSVFWVNQEGVELLLHTKCWQLYRRRGVLQTGGETQHEECTWSNL